MDPAIFKFTRDILDQRRRLFAFPAGKNPQAHQDLEAIADSDHRLAGLDVADDVLHLLVGELAEAQEQHQHVGGVYLLEAGDVRLLVRLDLARLGGRREVHRAVEAVRAAISSPLLEDVDIHGAKGVLVNVSAGPDMELDEFAQVGETISEYASEDATVVIGTVLDPAMEGNLRVTMVATGIRNPASGIPEVRVIEGGRAGEPQEIDYDQPTVIRRRPRESTTTTMAANAAENLDYLDIPAFLRRQAD